MSTFNEIWNDLPRDEVFNKIGTGFGSKIGVKIRASQEH